MARFLPCDYSQSKLEAVNYLDQLQPGTFEYALHYLIEHKLDLSAFEAPYRNDDTGRPAYAPAVMLKIILFAYAKGITSTREIQWQCRTNIIFQVLACGSEPHWTSIAAFVRGHREATQALFEQVLLVCDEQGLLGNELFAIDGCKIPSNAAKEWSGTFEELKRKREKLRRHLRHYLDEQARLTEEESDGGALAERATKAAARINAALEKIERFVASNPPRMGKGRRVKEVKSNITDNESAKMTTSKGTIQGYTGVAAVDKRHQVIVDAQAFGEGQEHHTLKPVLEQIRERYRRLGLSANIYAQGTVVTADTGFANEANMQYLYDNAINAYVPDNRFRSRDHRFAEQHAHHGRRSRPRHSKTFPASAFRFDPVSGQCRCPADKALWLKSERIDHNGHHKLFFEGRLTDCRHCALKARCMRRPDAADTRKGHGRQVSFIIERRAGATYTDWMKQRVDSPHGRQVYSHRMSVVEPMFANIGTQKGLGRFSLRGTGKVDTQWKLFALVHNIGKLQRFGKLAA